MAYETDEARDAARQRLRARMERRDAAQAADGHASAAVSKAPKPRVRKRAASGEKRPSVKFSRTESIALPSIPDVPATPSLPSIPPLVIVTVATLAAIALLALSLTQFAPLAPADDSMDAPFADEGIPKVTLDLDNETQAKLVSLIGEEETARLLGAACVNPDAMWIAAHVDEYGPDDEVQAKLLKLAADEPSAIDYVRSWPSRYPASKASADATEGISAKSPSQDIPDTAIPHLYQWDRRWGYTTYSSAPFGLAGCGPTALAMVAQALTEKHDITPYEMGEIAKEHGAMTEFDGTGSEFFVEMADELDLYCEQLYPTGDNIRSALDGGAAIVANLGPGQFTENGHYFVLAGLSPDGRVIVNDPYSVERSSQTWEAETIAEESIALFSYTSA